MKYTGAHQNDLSAHGNLQVTKTRLDAEGNVETYEEAYTCVSLRCTLAPSYHHIKVAIPEGDGVLYMCVFGDNRTSFWELACKMQIFYGRGAGELQARRIRCVSLRCIDNEFDNLDNAVRLLASAV